MGSPAHRAATLVLAAAMVLIGAGLVITALAAGGGPLSGRLILGVLFVAAGGARLFLLHRTRT
ncbi:MAG TPA: hypothetical protein VK279_01490 [Solirubrobacteraceae bacterium]|nr:hypothetical protein [Solirubrobacteraceae bacterium]